MTGSDNRVVAHLRDGRLVRGLNSDFRPWRPVFNVTTGPERTNVRLFAGDLKGLFFVKTLGGDPSHVHANAFDDGTRVGRCVWVVFKDGEQLAGRVLAVKLEHGGFFLFPTDPDSNLERAWIVLESTAEVLFDEEAAEAAERYEASPPPEGTRPRPRPDSWDDLLRSHDLVSPDRPEGKRPGGRHRASSDIFLGDW